MFMRITPIVVQIVMMVAVDVKTVVFEVMMMMAMMMLTRITLIVVQIVMMVAVDGKDGGGRNGSSSECDDVDYNKTSFS